MYKTLLYLNTDSDTSQKKINFFFVQIWVCNINYTLNLMNYIFESMLRLLLTNLSTWTWQKVYFCVLKCLIVTPIPHWKEIIEIWYYNKKDRHKLIINVHVVQFTHTDDFVHIDDKIKGRKQREYKIENVSLHNYKYYRFQWNRNCSERCTFLDLQLSDSLLSSMKIRFSEKNIEKLILTAINDAKKHRRNTSS